MESKVLRELSEQCGKYKYVLIYGAGGVASLLLTLLKPCHKINVVVSDKSENKPLMEGYPVKEISEFCGIREEVYVMIAVMPRHERDIEAHLKNLGFTNHVTASELVNRLYEEIWSAPVEKNKVVFMNGSGWGFGGNPKYIALDLMKTGQYLDMVWVSKDDGIKLPKEIRRVPYGSYEHLHELGTAGIWIDNQHKSFFTRKREGQIYIQTWHGGGPLKKIEFDAEGLPGSYLDLCEMNSKMEDIMISPSKFNSGLYRRAFHYKGEIMECGYPRNDIFWKQNACRQKIDKLFGIRPEEGIVLYAPTFRETESEDVEILDLEKMQRAFTLRFGKKYKVFLRCHPSDKESAGKYISRASHDEHYFTMNEQLTCPVSDAGGGEWLNVTDYDDPQELLAAADILVTDYSSIMWDFSLQRKPVFLFHPDLHLYEKERGYYLSFEEMPYIEAFSNEELCRKIMGFDEEAYQKGMTEFLTEYGSFDRGEAAQAVTDRILQFVSGR